MKPYLNKLNQKFEETIEEEFVNYSALKDKNFIRLSLVLFSFLYAFFSVIDYFLVPDSFQLFFQMRFGIVIPLLLMTFAFSYNRDFFKWKQRVITFDLIVGGLIIVLMMLIEPLNAIYYGGLFLVFTSGYFLLQLNAKNAILGGMIILFGFMIGIVWFRQVNLITLSMTLFFIAENIIGGLGAFQTERYKRNEFMNQHSLNISNNELNASLVQKISEVSKAQVSTIFALAKLAESRDTETGGHIERVGNLCHQLASLLPLEYYDSVDHKEEFCKAIQLASALHDIGKVGISDAILNKNSSLTEEEKMIMRTHTTIGYQTLSKLYEQYPNNQFVNLGLEITISHHERWDGTGYPKGLSGKDIPLSARIMAIIDVYDALISQRPYKPAYTQERTVRIIKEESGHHFDPDLVNYFIKMFSNGQ
jgi:HD-GYP domain-containing protein (c-di-GMP phosphodiesterase class II)